MENESLILQKFAGEILRMTGMNFGEDNRLALKVALKERMFESKIRSADEYFDYLSKNSSEREELIALLSVPETYFFRDKKQFAALRDVILPELIEVKLKSGVKPRIKIASCGCSTGQEPYTIAIAIDQGGLRGKADFEILAFDINKKSIERAIAGEYTSNSFREQDTFREIMPYFTPKGKNFLLCDDIRKDVKFYAANLFNMQDKIFILESADIVFLRNVAIYFTEEGKMRAIHQFERHMNKWGYLFLGTAESLAWKNTRFQFTEIRHAYMWRLGDHAPGVEKKQAPKKHPVVKPPPRAKQAAAQAVLVPEKKAEPRVFAPVPSVNKEPDRSHYENGLGYLQIKMLDKAETEFKEQLRITPRHIPTLIGLANLCADRGKDDQALSFCEQAVLADNLLPEAYLIRGLIAFKRRDFACASAEMKKTLYCNEGHYVARFYLALCYKEMSRPKEAQRELEIIVEMLRSFGPEELRGELAGHSASYILSLCEDHLGIARPREPVTAKSGA